MRRGEHCKVVGLLILRWRWWAFDHGRKIATWLHTFENLDRCGVAQTVSDGFDAPGVATSIAAVISLDCIKRVLGAEAGIERNRNTLSLKATKLGGVEVP